jgi:hypothetical protein
VIDTDNSSFDVSCRDFGGTGGGSDDPAAADARYDPSLLCIESRLLVIDGDREWLGVLASKNCPLAGLEKSLIKLF